MPSPKVATYDLKPEMSAFEVTDKLVDGHRAGKFDLIVVNYANTDMVGHTGDLPPRSRRWRPSITASAGCADAVDGPGRRHAHHRRPRQCRDDEGPANRRAAHRPHAEPRAGDPGQGAAAVRKLRDGRLADVAPTLLALMGLPPPAEMTGRSLIPAGAATAPAEEAGRRASA